MTPHHPHSFSGGILFRRLSRYLRPHWRPLLVALLAMAVAAATETGFAALMQPLLDSSFVERDMAMVQRVPLILIGIFLLRGLATFLSGYWMAWVTRQVIMQLRQQMFDQLLRLPVSYYDNTPTGQLVSKLIYDVEQVAGASSEVITTLVRDSLTVIGLLGWMFWIDWQLALLLLIGTPLVAQTIALLNRFFRRYSRRLQESMGDVTEIAEETIAGQRVVKVFGGERYERDRFAAINQRNQKSYMKLQAVSAASVPLVQMVSVSAAAGVIYIGSQAAVNGEMSIGTFVSFITAMMMMLSPTKRLTRINATLQRGLTAAESVFRFIDLPPEPDHGHIRLSPLTPVAGTVTFDAVDFCYPNVPERSILRSISLTIQAGETVALVGRSGGGKSTLASLLPRFYETTAGRILIDGIDIRDVALADLRSQIAIVTQHVTLFNDTIGRNIAYGRLEQAPIAHIRTAAAAAHALEFIDRLPAGLNTLVGENGLMLSGGQRQRIAIARAILKDAPILILDEATSALDTVSERYIQAALEPLMAGRTTLVIAHRLSTIERADRIVVLDQGQIVEQGSHRELLAEGGIYAELYRIQFADNQHEKRHDSSR